jgi:hypothetical protein
MMIRGAAVFVAFMSPVWLNAAGRDAKALFEGQTEAVRVTWSLGTSGYHPYSRTLTVRDDKWDQFDIDRVRRISFQPLTAEEFNTCIDLKLPTSVVKGTVTFINGMVWENVYIVMGLASWEIERPEGALKGLVQDKRFQGIPPIGRYVHRVIKTVTFGQ